MRLQAKFLIRFAPLMVLIVILSLLGIRTFVSYNKSVIRLKRDVEPGALAMLELKQALTTLELFTHTRNINREKLEELIQRLDLLAGEHIGHEHHGSMAEDSNHDLRHRALRSVNYAHYLARLEEEDWQNEARIRGFYTAIQRELLDLGVVLDKHLELHLKDLERTKNSLAGRYRTGIIVIWCGVLLGILITFYSFYSIKKLVLTPISLLEKSTKKIGSGKFGDAVALKTGDEFEELAGEFKNMAGKLEKSYRELDARVLKRTRELADANTALQNEIKERGQAEAMVHLLSQEMLKVQEIERKRISLDLHDNVAQELSALKLHSESLSSGQPEDCLNLQQKMTQWSEVLGRCIDTVRALSYNLRPPGLEQSGLAGALADYCRDFSRRNGIEVNFSPAGMDNLTDAIGYEISINLYRLVQEALNNALQHGACDQINLRLVASGSHLVLRIEDNGKGCDLEEVQKKAAEEKRFGLMGMQERVNLLDGTFKLSSRPGMGVQIFVEIPWKKPLKEEMAI